MLTVSTVVTDNFASQMILFEYHANKFGIASEASNEGNLDLG